MQRRAAGLPLVLAALVLAGCDHPPRGTTVREAVPGARPERAPQALRAHGCVGCHAVPGVRGEAFVGPPLTAFSKRRFIAGRVPNTPENLTTFILDPHRIKPGSAMPALGLSYEDARDIAAYLYTLR
jgi:cytochrome c